MNNPPIRKILFRAFLLFVVLNMIFALFPQDFGMFTLYNSIFPGRTRFPYGEDPTRSYNLTVLDLDAMFSSHVLAGDEKKEDDFRVFLIGDSSIWGWRLLPDETLTGQLNSRESRACSGQDVRFYNLGYPGMSLLKDLLILNESMKYQPDLILWFTTLEAFPIDKQTSNELVLQNQDHLRHLNDQFLHRTTASWNMAEKNIYERTILGQRRNSADLIRLQIYGVLWAATGIDQYIPAEYESAQIDLVADAKYYDMEPPLLNKENLDVALLETGQKIAGGIPIILINEPMLISPGLNNDIRYNYFYPRWAYDQYRDILEKEVSKHQWIYLDFWNSFSDLDFTNTPFHLNPKAETIFASQIWKVIETQICP